jgi:hypothetical protein
MDIELLDLSRIALRPDEILLVRVNWRPEYSHGDLRAEDCARIRLQIIDKLRAAGMDNDVMVSGPEVEMSVITASSV